MHLQLLNHNLEQQMAENKKLHQRLLEEHHLLKDELAKIAHEKQELLKVMQNKVRLNLISEFVLWFPSINYHFLVFRLRLHIMDNPVC